MNGTWSRGLIIIAASTFCCVNVIVAQVDIQGTVTDSIGNPVKGAIVLITGLNKKDTTDANGGYAIVDPQVPIVPSADKHAPQFRTILVQGKLIVFIPGRGIVSIKLFDITGKQLVCASTTGAGTGWQTVAEIDKRFAEKILLVCLEAKNGVRLVKTIYGTAVSGSRLINISDDQKISAKTAFASDTIDVTCRTYKRALRTITSYTGTQNFTLKQYPATSRLMGMKYLARDTFSMGQKGLYYDPGPSGLAEPVHKVTLSAFYIDSTEVTQADFENLMKTNPTFHPGHPLYAIDGSTWYDAVLYSNARSKKEGFDTVYTYTAVTKGGSGATAYTTNLTNCVIHYDRAGYRMPTEAEWEYACRGGTKKDAYWGSAPDSLYIWASNNSGWHTNDVAKKLSNAYKLYDMAGNCWEYCNDFDSVYTPGAQVDPTGPKTGIKVQLRGAAFHEPYEDIRFYSACRHGEIQAGHFNNVGFRVVFPDRYR